jgi:YD repeat-containing protein
LAQGAPLEMRDGQGHRVKFIRDSQRNLTELISPSGHRMTFKYDEAARIIEARTDVGDVRRYSYGPEGLLKTVSDGSRVLYRFGYENLLDAPGYEKSLMTSVTDGQDRLLLRNTYADRSRVSQQTLANGDTFRYEYDIDCAGDTHESSVTLPNGATKSFSFLPSKPACRTE